MLFSSHKHIFSSLTTFVSQLRGIKTHSSTKKRWTALSSGAFKRVCRSPCDLEKERVTHLLTGTFRPQARPVQEVKLEIVDPEGYWLCQCETKIQSPQALAKRLIYDPDRWYLEDRRLQPSQHEPQATSSRHKHHMRRDTNA